MRCLFPFVDSSGWLVAGMLLHAELASTLWAAEPILPSIDPPAHKRPYLMPDRERERLRTLIGKEEWAKEEYARLKTAAAKGDGFASAFLYGLEGDAKYIPAVSRWLLSTYGPDSYWIKEYNKRLADPQYFKQGQPGIPDVYYDTNITGLLAFDWAHGGLSADDRKSIQQGILTIARFRMKAMDRWTQTPNLVFKPTYLVAVTGLVTQDKECLEWGFRRTKPWGPHIGGYFAVLNHMLYDAGPWHEAPIYPIAHEDLILSARMSRQLGLLTGKDWLSTKLPDGGSPKGLADYYLDTAYPIERTGIGPGQIRIANYGDGSTNANGDLFLINTSGQKGNLLLHDPLTAAYGVSGDVRYAAFLSLLPDYKPDLFERRPLPVKTALPPAASNVWPKYGLAMLRSDESPSYWTSGKAIAVFQIMAQGYGHDHRDKFSITLHGANRLFYPNYNAIQYENTAIGWTRNSVSHNTLVVDEGETRDRTPTGIRRDFSPEVKFLATSASDVFEGVDQTRALLLTPDYLLDLFHAASPVPHTYDYLLHSFGKAQPAAAERFKPSEVMRKRYWLVDDQRTMPTSEAWSFDFAIKDESGKGPVRYGKEWYEHTARLRLTMAAEQNTQVTYGTWGKELAKMVAARSNGAVMDPLTMLAVRRAGVRDTVFVATHEPYANEDKPQVTRVTTLDRRGATILVRIDGHDFTDYAAVAFGPEKDLPEHVLWADNHFFAFRDYGYVRVKRDGSVLARGNWTAFRIPDAAGGLTLNGKPATTDRQGKDLVFGTAPAEKMAPVAVAPECPFPVTYAPGPILRVFERDRRELTFTLKNTLKSPVAARIRFDLPEGVSVEPAQPAFQLIPPGGSREAKVTVTTNNPTPGRHTIPYRVFYNHGGQEKESSTAALPLVVVVGPTLEYRYEHPRPYYLVSAPQLTAKFDMFHGLCRYLADDADTVRLDGNPLFTFSDGKTELLNEETKHAFTWPREAPADLVAHAYDRCRWQALFFGGRMMIRMDPGWTQFERTYFTIPGKWVSPGGAAKWKRIVADDGKEYDRLPAAKVKVTAAELEFPGGKYNLAFKFEPAQEVQFNELEMKFSLGSLTKDNWQIGFCRPGEFDAWRGKK